MSTATRSPKLLPRLEAGDYRTAGKSTTVSEAVEAYLVFLQTEGRARRTLTRYRGELTAFKGHAAGQRIRRI